MKLFPFAIASFTILAAWTPGDAAKPVWGTATNGLRCRIEMKGTVRQGERLDVSLHLDYSPQSPDVFRLVNWGAAECSYLELVDSEGQVTIRNPSVSGMPSFLPGGCDMDQYRELLAAGPAYGFRVPLLSSNGNQLAPGKYLVTAVYQNKGWQYVTPAPDSSELRTIWTGTIRSAPVMLTIKEGKYREVPYESFSGIKIIRTAEGLGWQWDPATRRTHVAKVRPGYITGKELNIYRGAARTWAGGMLGGGIHGSNQYDTFNLPAEFRIGDSLLVEVTVFETSEGTPHMWSPKSGDYRELLKQEVWAVIPPRSTDK